MLPRRGSNHGQAKLGERQAEEILIHLAEGIAPSALARRYAVTYGAIQAIETGRTWRHVRPDMPRRTDAGRRPGRKPESREWPSDAARVALDRIETAAFTEYLTRSAMLEEISAGLAAARASIDAAERVLHLANVERTRAAKRDGAT